MGKVGLRVVANNLKSLEVSMFTGVGKGGLRVVANNLKSLEVRILEWDWVGSGS